MLKTPLKSLNTAQRRTMQKLYMLMDSEQSRRYKLVSEAWAQGPMITDSPAWLKGHGFLLTWQGDFGLIPKEQVLGDSWPSVTAVATLLSLSPLLQPIKMASLDLSRTSFRELLCGSTRGVLNSARRRILPCETLLWAMLEMILKLSMT